MQQVFDFKRLAGFDTLKGGVTDVPTQGFSLNFAHK